MLVAYEETNILRPAAGLEPEASIRDFAGLQRPCPEPSGTPSPDVPPVRVRCLGVFTLETAVGSYIMTPCRRTRLLALLMVNSGAPVATSRLMAELWHDSPPDNAKNALYAQVVRLRRTIQEWGGAGLALSTQFPGYRLDLGTAALDVIEFDQQAALARRLRRNDEDRAIEVAVRALGLWNGPAFAGMTLGPLGEGVRRQLNENRFVLQLETIEMRLGRGEHGVLLPQLQELVQRSPLCEPLHAHLMIALYRAGRLADALQAFAAARQRFNHELGADPSPRLGRLVTLMLRHDPVLWQTPVYGVA